MSLTRYLSIVFLANLLLFGALGYFLRDPPSNPGWLWRLLVGAPGIAAFVTWQISRSARRVPRESRSGFKSYVWGIVFWAGLWAILAIALVAVLAGWYQ